MEEGLHDWLQATGLYLKLSQFLGNSGGHGLENCPLIKIFLHCISSVPPSLLGSTHQLNALLKPPVDLSDGSNVDLYKPLIRWLCDRRDPYRLPVTFLPGCGLVANWLDSVCLLHYLDCRQRQPSGPFICLHLTVTVYCSTFLALALYLNSKVGKGPVFVPTCFWQCFQSDFYEPIVPVRHSHAVLHQLLVGNEGATCVVSKAHETRQPTYQLIQQYLLPDLASIVLAYAGDDRVYEITDWRLAPNPKLVNSLLQIQQLTVVLPYLPTKPWGHMKPGANMLSHPTTSLLHQLEQGVTTRLTTDQKQFIAEALLLSETAENFVSKNQGVIQYCDTAGNTRYYAHTHCHGQHITQKEVLRCCQRQLVNAFKPGDGKTLTALALCLVFPKPKKAIHIIVTSSIEHYEEQLTTHFHQNQLQRYTIIRRPQDFQLCQKSDIVVVSTTCVSKLSKNWSPHLTNLRLLVLDGAVSVKRSPMAQWLTQAFFLVLNTSPTELDWVVDLIGSKSFCAASFPNALAQQSMVLNTKIITSSTLRRPIRKQLFYTRRSAMMSQFYETVLDGVSFGSVSLSKKEASMVLTSLQKISDHCEILALENFSQDTTCLFADRIDRFVYWLHALGQPSAMAVHFKWLGNVPDVKTATFAAAETWEPISKLGAIQKLLSQIQPGFQIGVFANNCQLLQHPKLWSVLEQYGQVVSIVNQKRSVALSLLQQFRQGRFQILLFNDATLELDLPEVTHLIVWSFDTAQQIQRVVDRMDRLCTSFVPERIVYLLLEEAGIHSAILHQSVATAKKRKRGADLAKSLLNSLSDFILGDTPNTFAWILKRILHALKRFAWVEQKVLEAKAYWVSTTEQPVDFERLEFEIKRWQPNVLDLGVSSYHLHLTLDLMVSAPDFPFSQVAPVAALTVIQNPDVLVFMSCDPVLFQKIVHDLISPKKHCL